MKQRIDHLEILDLLSSLCDKSLVIADASPSGVRYRLLETVRDYAGSLLDQSGEQGEVKNRHLEFFLPFTESAEQKLNGPEQVVCLDRLDAEFENLRTALEWSLDGGSIVSGLRLANALWMYWQIKGHYEVGLRWYENAFRFPIEDFEPVDLGKAYTRAGNLVRFKDPEAARGLYKKGLEIRQALQDEPGIASILHNLGSVEFAEGDYEAARSYAESSVNLRQSQGDEQGVCDTSHLLGDIANAEGNLELAGELYEKSLRISRQLRNKRTAALAMNGLGNVLGDMGDYPAAKRHYNDALQIYEEIGDTMAKGITICNLGLAEVRQGHVEEAVSCYTRGVAISLELRDWKNIAYALEGLAHASLKSSDRCAACRLWGAAEALREEIGCPMTPIDRRFYGPLVEEARALISSDVEFKAAWAEGREMDGEEAVLYALGGHGTRP